MFFKFNRVNKGLITFLPLIHKLEQNPIFMSNMHENFIRF